MKFQKCINMLSWRCLFIISFFKKIIQFSINENYLPTGRTQWTGLILSYLWTNILVGFLLDIDRTDILYYSLSFFSYHCFTVCPFLWSGQQCVVLPEWRSDSAVGTQRGIRSVWGDPLFCWVVSNAVAVQRPVSRRFRLLVFNVCTCVVSAAWRTVTTSSSESTTTSRRLLITEPPSSESSGDALGNLAKVEVNG